MVLHTFVVKDIGAYLAAPLYLHLACLYRRLRLHALLHGAVIELGLQQTHGVLTVLLLLARLGVGDKYLLFLARIGVLIHITQAHARLHLVDILSAGTAGAECVP